MHTLSDIRSGRCDGIRHLVLKEDLAVFPDEILRLADTLEILDLSGNRLRSLPDSFARLSKLRIAFFSFNEFETFPDVLGRCPSLEMAGFKSNRISFVPENALPERLRWLILTGNTLKTLPDSLGARPRLQKLMLAGNRLESLPDLSRCENLELVRIADNALPELPDFLFDLPRLAWLAFSGNPFCMSRTHSALEISWDDLSVQGKIGEGASGQVYRAKRLPHSSDVAVKVYKSCSTSDGRTCDEMAAVFAAGTHRNLVPVLGRLQGHPDGADGIVLELIPPGFCSLASPPSFESCTRDVYDLSVRFARPAADRLVSELAALMDFLHGRGLCHGDFYGHNVLADAHGGVLLCDFGAAGFLDDLPRAQAEKMVTIERRALDILCSEISSMV